MKDKQDKMLTNKVESHVLAENILKDSSVRPFSHAKDINEKYQIRNKKVKKKSLSAGLKIKKADEI